MRFIDSFLDLIIEHTDNVQSLIIESLEEGNSISCTLRYVLESAEIAIPVPDIERMIEDTIPKLDCN